MDRFAMKAIVPTLGVDMLTRFGVECRYIDTSRPLLMCSQFLTVYLPCTYLGPQGDEKAP